MLKTFVLLDSLATALERYTRAYARVGRPTPCRACRNSDHITRGGGGRRASGGTNRASGTHRRHRGESQPQLARGGFIDLRAGATLDVDHVGGGKTPYRGAGTAGLRYDHFARHNKGLNDYADADLLAIVGHFSPPLDDIEARVLALRGNYLPQRTLRDTERRKEYLPQRATKNHEGGSENRIGEENVQAAMETCLVHSISTSPTTFPLSSFPSPFVAFCGGNSPSPSFSLTALPVARLPVAELTDVNDIIGAQRITEAQRAALDAGRDAANAQRHADAIAKIEAAKAELHAAGLVVASPRQVAEVAGVARSTLWTYGYSYGGRWLRLADMRDTYSLNVYLSFHVCPAPPQVELSAVVGASTPRHTPLPDDYAHDSDPWDTP